MNLSLIRTATDKALSITKTVQWAAPLLARLTVGVVFATSGWGKVHHLDKVTAFFTELHIPAPAFQAVFVSYVELICGSLLVMGLASRLAAIPLIISMTVALITAKADDIHGIADLFGVVEFTYIALLFWIAISGPGSISIDRLVAPRIRAFPSIPSVSPETRAR